MTPNTTSTASTTNSDLAAIKTRQQAAWAAGDFGVVGTTLQIVGETLCEAVDLRAGARVLDVACGNGNASLAAARRWCNVTAIDYVPALLEQARVRAAAERLDVMFELGDAEALDFPDETFDYVLSTFGVMFAPDQARAARELVRVCKPGGTIGLANWTPGGFAGQMFRIVAQHIPPSPAVKPPPLWGTRERLQELFAAHARNIRIEPRSFAMRYESAEHWLSVFRQWFGPLLTAYSRLDAAGQSALTRDLLDLAAKNNRSSGRGFVAPSEYLEVVITRW
jgi:ubiquinone/menaquinone biosynthesis C-methylase UbiE